MISWIKIKLLCIVKISMFMSVVSGFSVIMTVTPSVVESVMFSKLQTTQKYKYFRKSQWLHYI